MKNFTDNPPHELGQTSRRVEDTLLGQVYALFMAVLVLTICTTFVIETYPLPQTKREALHFLDKAITVWFLVDYLLRWWVKHFSIRYLFTLMALIDLITILPLFLAEMHWQFVRVLRIFRILRLLRLLRKNGLLFFTMTEFHLRVLRIMYTLFCLIFISSGLIYDVDARYCKRCGQLLSDQLVVNVDRALGSHYGKRG